MRNTMEFLLFEQSPDALILIDPADNEVQLINAQARDLLGFTGREALSQSVSADRIFSGCWPEFIVFSQEVLHKKTAWSGDLSLRTEDGGEEELLVAASLIEGTERNILLRLLSKQALQSQNRFLTVNELHRKGLQEWKTVEGFFEEFELTNSLILNAVGEGVYGVDINGNATFLNPVAEEILGWKADELIGENMHRMIHHSHHDGSHYHVESCHIYSAFQDGRTKQVQNEYFWNKQGKAFPVEYVSTPIMDEGQVVGAVIVFRDVSERKKAEARIGQMLKEMEELKRRLELENAYLQEAYKEVYHFNEIVGTSEAVQKIVEQIRLVSPTDANVLITGESGTGKELIARAIHENSLRKNRPLIRVNCASIPKDLFESEFFGHTKGAFTGAVSDRVGRFELADGGTIFLDEIGEIPYELQSKLLRVLQEQQFERLGDSRTRKVNVRIIAATNRNLLEEVRRKAFREDLYFRLNVFPIESPPLRQRGDDIPVLAQHFLKLACEKYTKAGLQLKVKHIHQLQAYHWPGNIRELIHVIERTVILAHDGQLVFNLDFLPVAQESGGYAASDQSQGVLTYNELRSRERENLIQALEQSGGKIFGKGGAGELLQINPTTLNSKLKKFNIDKYGFKAS
ncbi:sigma 54-interacting transcriptional regulator [Thiomicrorhabdus sp. 6S3-12]|uniref:sigma 54-interacting transcriptional regulator n=1 Tax=Thiomicrorhabdus sp. 6S3-12 TaxID=2819681 RepID=UPI001AAE0E8A|nr:sigma 54-interacting transcriptional regulator [Thiomicrorhabdus sp. 6S3-12]MBO1923410.1 sigma 54-interacting transcriptional regulator [Thiomicrorhabdus sp. 6S3-12]